MQQNATNGISALKLAVVGGGRRCHSLLQMIDANRLAPLKTEVVGVADINPQAPGLLEAQRRGVFTTNDFHQLLDLEDLDLIIELTGKEELLRDLVRSKPETVGIIDYTASVLFQNIVSFGQELARKEDEISVERSYTQSLTKATILGVMVLDPDYRIVRINRVACQWAQMDPEEARGRFCFQVLRQYTAPCGSRQTPCPMRETIANKATAHAIHEFSDSQGQAHYCDVTTYPLINRQGKVVQVLEVFRDITNELASRVEMRTRAIKDDLARLIQEDKLLALGKLVASVAHEINNPLASIINFSKLILKQLQQGPPSQEELEKWVPWLEMTVREAQRSSEIVGNLLSFARQKSLEPQEVDLRHILHQIVELTKHRMELSKIELACQLPQGQMEVWGDATQLQQCLTNLIFNALEAMPEGGRLTIRGGRDAARRQIWVEVSDTGKGITPQDMPRIFEPFFTTKDQGQGVGLGLSMVYGIISEHRGFVDVDSAPGRGSTFRVTLPSTSQDPRQEVGG